MPSRSIHFVTNGRISLFLMAEKYPCVCVCVCVCFFIHSSVDRHLGWCHNPGYCPQCCKEHGDTDTTLRCCNHACFTTKELLIVKAQGFAGLVPVSLRPFCSLSAFAPVFRETYDHWPIEQMCGSGQCKDHTRFQHQQGFSWWEEQRSPSTRPAAVSCFPSSVNPG